MALVPFGNRSGKSAAGDRRGTKMPRRSRGTHDEGRELATSFTKPAPAPLGMPGSEGRMPQNTRTARRNPSMPAPPVNGALVKHDTNYPRRRPDHP